MTRDDALLECLTRWGTQRGFVDAYAEETKGGFVVGFLRRWNSVTKAGSIIRKGQGASFEEAFASCTSSKVPS